MPNAFAYFMVFGWPVIALVAFRRLPLSTGVAAAMVGGYLLLPSRPSFDLPLLPTFNKPLSLTLAGLLLILAAPRSRGPAAETPDLLPGWLPRALWIRLCLAGIVGGSLVTVLLNGETLFYGQTVLAGLTLYDAASDMLTQVMWLLPFLIARHVFASPEAQVQLLRVLIVSAVLYSFLALVEVRMSPQLNSWVYGFFPHKFIQHVRGNGYRPVVFLAHGLRLSLFLAITFLGALAYAYICPRKRRSQFMAIAGFLFVVLVLSKSMGALVTALLFAPVVMLAPSRVQLLFAAGITAAVLVYPVLRGNDLVPVERILSATESIAPKRAESFATRLKNEDALLAKASQKPLFGWGGWGRSRVYDERGEDITVTDGTWVIQFGVGGWMRYLSIFGLLGLPVLLTARRQKVLHPDAVTIALTLMLAANLIDLIPNSGLTPVTWMLAGALAGRLEWQGARAPVPMAAAAPGRPSAFAPGPAVTARSAPAPDTPPPYRSPYAPVLHPHPERAHGKDVPAR